MASDDTVTSVLVGGLVTIFLSPVVPFAPVLGGALAGYIRGGSRMDGVKVGAYSGAVALIPLVLLVTLFGNLFLAFLAGAAPGFPPAAGGLTAVVLIFALISALVYTVAFAAVGGWIGNYVKRDTDIDI